MLGKKNRLLGGILLVSGTTIGAGMLALPVMTASAGFWRMILLLFLCWLLMLATAFFFLDVNLAVRGEPNLISMSARTLGTPGKVVSWVFYLLLLYSLTAAYIAGSTPLFVQAIASLTGIIPSSWVASFSLPILFGGFIYLGTRGVDYINRMFMVGLVVAYLLLAGLIPPHLDLSLLRHHNMSALTAAVPILFTSFGYHIIIPSLTTYMEHDAKKLRLVIVIGSLIPLAVYVLWQLLVQGTVPLPELLIALQRGEPTTAPLARIVQSSWIAMLASFFSFFAIVTSFLGVTLSLSDFLIDGLKIKKTWEGKLMALALTFLPPLLFVFTCQKGFYLALQHAGAIVAILLGILPACMAWKLKGHKFYRSLWGRGLLAAVILFSAFVVVLDLI